MSAKTKIAAAISASLAALSAASYFGYQYFTENYVLLNQQEAFQIMMFLLSCSAGRPV